MMHGALALGVVVALVAAVRCQEPQFDDDFMFGVASAAYQVEGSWAADGKGENIWDHMLHEHPEYTADEENGDIAAASYFLYKEDVAMVKAMNMDFYRFSISWSRILPKGDLSVINQKGIDYYNNLIDELKKNDIEPVVTMYHWDLPYELQRLGGWPNRNIAKYFEDYADLLYKTFGDRVKWWITFNEPQTGCRGYSADFNVAPMIETAGVGDYLCAHTILLAHSYAYERYSEYRQTQGGQVGITLNAEWAEPKTTAAAAAAERQLEFWVGWIANPIFSSTGGYPTVMIERIQENSERENLSRSRLPEFTDEEKEMVKGSADFFGLNHYTTNYAEDGILATSKDPSRERDSGVITSQDDEWPGSGSDWLKVKPEGFRKMITWIHDKYNGPTIFVTENGVSDKADSHEDEDRIEYFKSYLTALHEAITEDGVNVIGYTAWSLMDNFEWLQGYTQKFGVYHVNYESPSRTRSPKQSSYYLADVARTHRINSAASLSASLLLSLVISGIIVFRRIM